MAQRFVDQFEVRTLAPDNATLEELSGGNQKVVLAKGLTRKALVAIIDEPTAVWIWARSPRFMR